MPIKKKTTTIANIINLGFIYQNDLLEIIYGPCTIMFRILKEYWWMIPNDCISFFKNKVLSYLSEYFLWLPFLLIILCFLLFLYDLFGSKIIILIYQNRNFILILINFLGLKLSTIILRKLNPYYTVKNNYWNISTTGDNGHNNNNSDNQTIFTWKNLAIGALVVMTISGTVVGIFYFGPDLVESSRQVVTNYIASQPRYRLMAGSNSTMSADEASIIVSIIGTWLYQNYMWVPSAQDLLLGEYFVKGKLDETGKLFWTIIKDGGDYIITGSKERGFDIAYPNTPYDLFIKELSEGANFTINTTKSAYNFTINITQSAYNFTINTTQSACNFIDFTVNTTQSACKSIIRMVATPIDEVYTPIREVGKDKYIEIFRLKRDWYIIKGLGIRVRFGKNGLFECEI